MKKPRVYKESEKVRHRGRKPEIIKNEHRTLKSVVSGLWSVKKINHENTKSKKHKMFRANFRVFVMKKMNIQLLIATG